MKTKLITILFLLVSVFANAQNTVRRYNELLERYEYFDSNRKLIGYEKWNSLYNQWEYTDLRSRNNGSTYIPPYNMEVVGAAMRLKQERHDRNLNIISNKGQQLYNTLLYIESVNGGLTQSQSNAYNIMINKINTSMSNADISDNNSANYVIRVIDNFIHTVSSWDNRNKVKRESTISNNRNTTTTNKPNKNEPKSITKAKPKNIQGFYPIYSNVPIYKEPTASSSIIKKASGQVEVIGLVDNTSYYKVVYKGVTGYMLSTWIK